MRRLVAALALLVACERDTSPPPHPTPPPTPTPLPKVIRDAAPDASDDPCAGPALDLDALFASEACRDEHAGTTALPASLRVSLEPATVTIPAGGELTVAIAIRNPTAAPVTFRLSRCGGDQPLDYEFDDPAGKRVDLAPHAPSSCAMLCAGRTVRATITPGGVAKLALPITAKLERTTEPCDTERVGAVPRGTWTLRARTPVGEMTAPVIVR